MSKKEEEGFVRLGEHLHEDAEQHRVCNFVQLQSSTLPQYDNGWGIPCLSGIKGDQEGGHKGNVKIGDPSGDWKSSRRDHLHWEIVCEHPQTMFALTSSEMSS